MIKYYIAKKKRYSQYQVFIQGNIYIVQYSSCNRANCIDWINENTKTEDN